MDHAKMLANPLHKHVKYNPDGQ